MFDRFLRRRNVAGATSFPPFGIIPPLNPQAQLDLAASNVDGDGSVVIDSQALAHTGVCCGLPQS